MASDEKSPPTPPQNLLWAPWRIEYIRGIKPDECFICKKLADDDNSLVIERGETCLILLNAYPYNSGHALVAPYRHIADLSEVTEQEMMEMMRMIQKMKRVQDQVMYPDGYNFGFNLGAAAGAGLRTHIHGHLVPRWAGDTNFMPVLGNTRVVPEALRETARILRKAWQEDKQEEDAK